MDTILEFSDHLGPLKIVHLNLAKGLKAIAVVDNVACGQAIGGVRMAPDVSPTEVVLSEQRVQTAMADQKTLHVPNFALMT